MITVQNFFEKEIELEVFGKKVAHNVVLKNFDSQNNALHVLMEWEHSTIKKMVSIPMAFWIEHGRVYIHIDDYNYCGVIWGARDYSIPFRELKFDEFECLEVFIEITGYYSTEKRRIRFICSGKERRQSTEEKAMHIVKKITPEGIFIRGKENNWVKQINKKGNRIEASYGDALTVLTVDEENLLIEAKGICEDKEVITYSKRFGQLSYDYENGNIRIYIPKSERDDNKPNCGSCEYRSRCKIKDNFIMISISYDKELVEDSILYSQLIK